LCLSIERARADVVRAGFSALRIARQRGQARTCCVSTPSLGFPAKSTLEGIVTQSDDMKISEDRRDALRYALALGSGAALTSALASPASAQAAADNTLDRIRADKVLRIAVLPGELPYFSKDLATGTWSGFSIEMANDIAKLLDVKLEYTESTYGNSILDLQANKIDLGFALNPTPQRALVVDFTNPVFPHPFGAMLKKGLEAKTWSDINKPEVNIAVDVGSANEAVARRFAPNASIKSLKSRDEVMLEMSSGRVDCVVNALVLGLTAIAKNPNLGTYKILQSPAVTIASSMAVRRESDKRWRDFLSVWVDYNRGVGQMREWFVKGLALSSVKPEDVPVELNI
jgi:polar amino acid transport system substrate-binding protein